MPKTQTSTNCSDLAIFQELDGFHVASELLKALSHEGRLKILCHLSKQTRSVGELATLLSLHQSAASQQLKILRAAGLVTSSRKGTSIYYSLTENKVIKTVDLLYSMFNATDGPAYPSQCSCIHSVGQWP